MGPELLETDSCSQGFISATATLRLASRSLGVWCAIETQCCRRGKFWWEVLTADYPSMPHLGGGIRLSDVDWGVLVLFVSHMRGGPSTTTGFILRTYLISMCETEDSLAMYNVASTKPCAKAEGNTKQCLHVANGDKKALSWSEAVSSNILYVRGVYR